LSAVIGTEGFREQYAEEKVKELILSSKLPTTYGIRYSDAERHLFLLPVKLGGLGIPIFSEIADREYKELRLVNRRASLPAY